MNEFKEWLSDYLRYFLLILAAVIAVLLILAGIRIYERTKKPDSGEVIQILTERETEKETESAALSETEGETEPAAQSETEEQTESTAQSETKRQTESTAQSETKRQTESAAQSETKHQTESTALSETEPQTEAVTETEYTPVYKTLKGSCYIRSGPSMEAEIIGEYMYGTTVEFLEDVGGWYKVQIDGMVGYMGARFF